MRSTKLEAQSFKARLTFSRFSLKFDCSFITLQRDCLFISFFPVLPLANVQSVDRGTQRIVSANYLLGRPLTLFDFLKRIVTSNFRDMRN